MLHETPAQSLERVNETIKMMLEHARSIAAELADVNERMLYWSQIHAGVQLAHDACRHQWERAQACREALGTKAHESQQSHAATGAG